MGKFRWIYIMMLIFISAGCGGKITPEEESAAMDQAKAWLVLVDSEEYETSWREASDFLKENVAEQKWVETMMAVRKPMGSIISRKVKFLTHQAVRENLSWHIESLQEKGSRL